MSGGGESGDEPSDDAAVKTAIEAADGLEDADEDITTNQRWYAKAYLTALFGGAVVLLVGGTAALYAVGALSLDVDVALSVDVGWVVEYIVAGLAAAFLLWTFAMILVALPGSFVAAVVRFAAGVAEAGQRGDNR